jgi:predicted dehydrogenase
VLIEKPMTITAGEAEDLVRIAEQRELQFVISCPWHYTAHSVEARRLVRAGALGAVKMVSVLMTNYSEGLYRGLPWTEAIGAARAEESAAEPYLRPGRTSYSDPEVAGGGQIYCQVSHAAAHLALVTSAEPAEVFARFDNAGTVVDVYDTLDIKLDNGALVSMASTGATMKSERTYEVRIYGTEGMLFMELWKGTMEHHDAERRIRRYPRLRPEDVYPHRAPATNLVDAVLGTAENGSPASLGLSAMRMIEAACRSAKTGGNVIIGGPW